MKVTELQHIFPNGLQDVEENKFALCEYHTCEICSSFMMELNEIKLREFLTGEGFTNYCSSIRVVIPIEPETSQLFTIQGFEKLLADLTHNLSSVLGSELSETQTILVPSPIFMYSFDKPALCIDLFMKPELSDELVKYFRGTIDELKEIYGIYEWDFREFTSDFIDRDMYTEMATGFDEAISYFKSIQKLCGNQFPYNEMKFVLSWGVMDVKFNMNNNQWEAPMLLLNRDFIVKNKLG
jgi:hypothetical protein